MFRGPWLVLAVNVLLQGNHWICLGPGPVAVLPPAKMFPPVEGAVVAGAVVAGLVAAGGLVIFDVVGLFPPNRLVAGAGVFVVVGAPKMLVGAVVGGVVVAALAASLELLPNMLVPVVPVVAPPPKKLIMGAVSVAAVFPVAPPELFPKMLFVAGFGPSPPKMLLFAATGAEFVLAPVAAGAGLVGGVAVLVPPPPPKMLVAPVVFVFPKMLPP